MKQNVKIGLGSIKYLEDILEQHSFKKIMFITGKKSYFDTNIKNKVQKYLSKYKFVHFYDFENNTKYQDVIKGTLIFKKSKCDLILAIGGGSVIDMAKCINAFQSHKEVDYIKFVRKNLITNKGVPLIVIPTTSGTGSEATHFSVIYIKKMKFSLSSKYLIPRNVIIDPSFSMFQNQTQIASSGMDAFCQAIESYWAVNSTNLSKKYAMKAIILCKNNILNAVNRNRQAIYNMSIAAYYSGKAINISKTTAPHAVSYPITTYLGLPHGHAVSLTLPQFMKFNYNITNETSNDDRGFHYVIDTIDEILQALNLDNIENMILYFNQLLTDIGLLNNEIRTKIKKHSNVIIKDGFNPDRINNNPRNVTIKDLNLILNNI